MRQRAKREERYLYNLLESEFTRDRITRRESSRLRNLYLKMLSLLGSQGGHSLRYGRNVEIL